MSITTLILVCTATLIGFFAGIVIAALTVKRSNKTDESRFMKMVEHQDIVERRLSRYSDHAERTADALESIAEHLKAK